MKGVGRIYQQTFIDTYAKIAFAKLYDRKTPLPRLSGRRVSKVAKEFSGDAPLTLTMPRLGSRSSR